MNIIIIAVGRIRSGPEKTLIENYSRRIKWPIEFREVEEKKKLKGLELKKRQGDLLLNQCPPKSKILLLDQYPFFEQLLHQQLKFLFFL